MNETPFEKLFRFASKAVIIIPVCIIVAVLIYKFVPDKTPPTRTFSGFIPTATPAPVKKNTFNLVGPLLCQVTQNGASMSAQIKDNQIAAQIQNGKLISYYTINGDCLYQWDNTATPGTKMCNIGSVLSLVSLVSSLPVNLGSMPQLESLLPKGMSSGSSALSLENFKQLTESCKTASVEAQVFDIPKNKTFLAAPTTAPTVAPKK